MAIKKSKTVALEGRSDLTSFLGLIGRYGPTAAVTVIAMLSLWAGFIIYRTVRRRRRKADGTVLGPEKDAGMTTMDEETESSVGSTEHIDEGLPEMMCSKSESVLTEMSETNRSGDASEDDDADWLPLELNDPAFSTGRNSEPSDWCLGPDQEPASDCLFNGTTNEMGHLFGMDGQCPPQSSLKAYSQGWSTNTEDQGVYPPQALDEDKPQEGPERADNLPDMENSDGDLNGLQRGQVYVKREVEISSHELTIKEKTWTSSTTVKDGSPHVRDQLVCVEYVQQESLVNQPQPKDDLCQRLRGEASEDGCRVDVIDRLNQLVEESERNGFQFGELVDVQNGLAEQMFESDATGFINPLSELTSMIDQWMEPTKGRNPCVVFEKVEKVERVKSLDAEEEVCYEKTEINIMEATMDNNEWMTVDITEETMRIVPLTHLQEDEDKNMPVDRKSSASAAPLDADEGNKNVLVVQPLPQMVHVRFSVHYRTTSPCQVLAVTGNQKELGSWKSYVPLERAKDGVWANSVSLPADSQVEWKFVLVEEGGIKRWEECGNRHLDTGNSQAVRVHKWWGYL